jgi:3-hydroxyisobutyrate dehydrogenase-like beta-hydroxyacid dehydrogenase
MARVAFIGLGVMGYPIAGHLRKKGGHDVTVYNRTPARASQWVKEHGGASAPAPREAARDTDFVFCCPEIDGDMRSIDSRDKGGSLNGAPSIVAY